MLRIFGMDTEAIKKAFEKVDTGLVKYIEATFKKDVAKDAAESYVEIYQPPAPGRSGQPPRPRRT